MNLLSTFCFLLFTFHPQPATFPLAAFVEVGLQPGEPGLRYQIHDERKSPWANGKYKSACESDTFHAELEKFAASERRTLGNVVELLLEWAFAQLQAAGSLTRLLSYQLGKRKDPPK